MKEELTKKRKPETTTEAVENRDIKIWPREGIHGGVRPAVKSAVAKTAVAGGPITSGDGGVTAFHDNGGRILESCRVILVFWGTAWSNPATSPSSTQFANALTGIATGVWGTQLAQYRGVGPISMENTILVTASDPPTSFTNTDIQNMLRNQIDLGNLPNPDNNIDRVYCVLMPTGHSSGDTSFVGQHQFFDYNGGRAIYAWVTNDGTLTGGNSMPKVFSHELSEAITDPNLGNPDSGILVDIGSDTNEEIGDVCNNTYATVNGVAEEAYWSNVDNRCVIPVGQPFPAAVGNPVLLQSRFGNMGNFEFVSPLESDGLFFSWRNNDNGFLPWGGIIPFAQSLGRVDAVTMIQSNFGSPGNLELIARVGDTLQFFWRDSGPAFAWSGPFQIGQPGVSGNPVLIQSRFGAQGNFELVMPLAGGGLAHYWRNNDDPSLPWSALIPFGQNLGQVDAVTMIQSNFGSPGNLELIARVGDTLQFFWRDSGPAFNWNGPFQIGGPGVSGNPVLIQSRFGAQGNFELVVPLAGGGLAHYWRNNDDPSLPWGGPFPFGGSLGQLSAVTMIQSNFGVPGNLELIALAGNQLNFFWRDSGPAFNWNGPYGLQATVW